MNRAEQAQQAQLFRNKHRGPRLLLLPNAWDAMSARIFIAAGFDALATTSGGVAWALGYPDGEAAPWAEVVTATARIVRAAQVADKRRQPYQRRLPHRSRQLPSPRTSSRQPRSRIISCALKMPGRQKDAGGLCGLDDQYRRL